jgi:arginyl-tRNA synthetase
MHSIIQNSIAALYGQEVSLSQIQLQKTNREFKGHLTLVVFPLLKISKKNPEQTALEIGNYLVENEPIVAEFNVVKGFLNLTITPAYWVGLLNAINASQEYGTTRAEKNAPLVILLGLRGDVNYPWRRSLMWQNETEWLFYEA